MECECTCRCMSIGKMLFFSNVCMSASGAPVLAIPSIMPFRGYMISKLYHVTAVTVHRLDGIMARTRTCYIDSTLRKSSLVVTL
jgi:hypothetical protein